MEIVQHENRQAQERIDRLGRLLATEIRAHDETKRVLAEARADKDGRLHYLDGELKDMTRSRDDLIGVADGLQTELRGLEGRCEAMFVELVDLRGRLALKAKKRKR
jgi:hypothetical protein